MQLMQLASFLNSLFRTQPASLDYDCHFVLVREFGP